MAVLSELVTSAFGHRVSIPAYVTMDAIFHEDQTYMGHQVDAKSILFLKCVASFFELALSP